MQLMTPEEQVAQGAEVLKNIFEFPNGWLERRYKQYVEVRVALCAFYMEERGFNMSQIGRGLNKDHATVLHARVNNGKWSDFDKSYRSVKTAVFNALSDENLTPMSYEELFTAYKELQAEVETLKAQLPSE